LALDSPGQTSEDLSFKKPITTLRLTYNYMLKYAHILYSVILVQQSHRSILNHSATIYMQQIQYKPQRCQDRQDNQIGLPFVTIVEHNQHDLCIKLAFFISQNDKPAVRRFIRRWGRFTSTICSAGRCLLHAPLFYYSLCHKNWVFC